MKNSSGAAGQQLSREIGFLARKVINDDFSREMVRREIESRFTTATRSDRERILGQVVQRCYTAIWLAMPASRKHARTSTTRTRAAAAAKTLPVTVSLAQETFALRAARIITELVADDPGRYACETGYRSILFDAALDRLVDQTLFDDCDCDPELAHIYLKQTALILKKSAPQENAADWYRSLFLSFWNLVKWERLFPSMPEAAGMLQLNRGIAADIVMKSSGAFHLAETAGEIIEMTGMGRRDNLMLVSFIDFSLFTWLRHFGIMDYCAGSRTAAMRARLTDHGRAFLGSLQNQ